MTQYVSEYPKILKRENSIIVRFSFWNLYGFKIIQNSEVQLPLPDFH